MKTRFALPVLLIVIALTAGCSAKKEKTNGDDGASAESIVGKSVEPRYWHLAGTVGKYPIIMDLAVRHSNDEEVGYAFQGYHGTYYYLSKEDIIDLYGSLDSTGQLYISEVSYTDDGSGVFLGEFDPEKGIYKGSWTSGDGKRSLPFELKEDYSKGAVRFSSRQFERTEKLFPQEDKSPSATFSLVWLYPVEGSTDVATAAFLEDEIRKGMAGDSLAAIHSDPGKLFDVLDKSFFRMYREDMDDVKPEEIEDDYFVAFTYEQNASVEVLYNTGSLLTFGFWNYWFSGGAHGNYATLLQSYDLAAKKAIELDDVFLPGFEEKIAPALERAARNRLGIPKSEPLGSALFSDEIEPTENFGLTGKGIIFNYPPYEIAAYALGEIRLFVPYSEVSDMLRPEFKSRYVSVRK